MTTAQHTPGPFIVGHSFTTAPGGITKELTSVYAENGNRRVADMIAVRGDFKEAEANARLFSATLESHSANVEALHALSQARSVLYNAYGKDGAELPHRKAAIELLDRTEEVLRAAMSKASGNAPS